MKTIDEKFDEKFNHDNPLGKALVLIEGNDDGDITQRTIHNEIKQFYNKEIKKMVEEMIGEERYTATSSNRGEGYLEKRQEIINIAKEYGFK